MKKYKHSFLLFISDSILLNSGFFIINYYKRGTFKLSPEYNIKLLFAINLIWIAVSVAMKKFNPSSYKKGFRDTNILLINSTVVTCYVVSLMVVLMGFFTFSRLQIFGTFLLLLVAEIVIFSVYYLSYGRESSIIIEKKEVDIFHKQRISTRLLIADFLFINLSFFAVNYFKRGTFRLNPGYEKLLLIFYGLWLVTSLITRKFDKDTVHDFINAIGSCFKSVFLMTATMAVLVFSLRLHYYSRTQIFGALLIFFFLEILLYCFYVINKKEKASEKDIESTDLLQTHLLQQPLSLNEESEGHTSSSFIPIREKLEIALEFFSSSLFDFIDSTIDLSKISRQWTNVFSTNEIINLKTIDDWSSELIINLHKTNDIRWINRYFIEVYNKIKNGGYFVGMATTISAHKKSFFDVYSKYFVEILYIVYFFLFRVAPKIPVIKKVYFIFTKGKNRVISKAELFGRLYFCGFEIIAEKDFKENVFFIARKAKTPSKAKSPSYGPLVKLNRSGMNGQPITVYKFRTMHPYSEFLQEYIYKNSNLQEGGKFSNDFRVTGWGKFMRKFWLDELPMLYNWLRGDLQLVGVRPLSSQYLGLYSEKLQEMRNKVKPGLIPPFYVDLPKTFDEICESEKRYIAAYLKNPLKTQWVYFWRVFYNIVIKGVRSS